jgi:hypothetical protein
MDTGRGKEVGIFPHTKRIWRPMDTFSINRKVQVVWIGQDIVHHCTYLVYVKDGITRMREYDWETRNWYDTEWWRSVRDLIEMIVIIRGQWVIVQCEIPDNKEWDTFYEKNIFKHAKLSKDLENL